MINVVYNKGHNKLSVTGHAGSAEKGKDLICAATTILVNTVAAAVEKFAYHDNVMRSHCIEIKDGNAQISYTPAHRYKATIGLAIDSICIGFELLAVSYPENISYQELS